MTNVTNDKYVAPRGEGVPILFLFFGFLIGMITANQSTAESIARRLRLYPHVIKTIPSKIIEVTYGEHELKLGELLYADEIDEPPFISWPAKRDALYVMVLSGPDASNLDSAKNSYEHWIVGNIPGTNLEEGEQLSEYVGLTKAAYRRGETHRLVFYIFEQPDGERIPFEGARIKKKDTGRIRGMLSLENFAIHYELGDPCAIHFFEVFFNKTKL